MNAAIIMTAVKAYMEQNGLKFFHDASRNVFILQFSNRGKFNVIQEKLRIRDDGIVSLATCPIKADDENRVEVIKYINKLNWQFRSGNFELDPADGEVQFRVFANLEGLDESSPIQNIIENVIFIPVQMIRDYGDNLFKVMLGQSTAENIDEDDSNADD